MKPQVGGESTRSEMAQEEFDPLDLMSGVAMLVLEARTPDNSVKGRVEGPHCPSYKKEGHHLCSKETLECLRAREFRERIDVMWRNGIPSRVDILLFPACSHGQNEARSLDCGAGGVQENSLLLERWTIHCIQKWHGAWSGGVSGTMLLQAVRSYLYFSQLSSWLASMHGCLPITIACRLYAPGEEAGVDFVQPPDSHAFPTGIYGPHGLKVHVHALPRQESVPALLCAWAGDSEEASGLSDVFVPGLDAPTRERRRKDADRNADRHNRPRKPAPSRTAGGGADREADSMLGRKKTTDNKTQNESGSETEHKLSLPAVSQATVKPHRAVCEKQPDVGHLSQPKTDPEMLTAFVADRPRDGGGKSRGQRSSARDWLESQLQPLELSPAAVPQALDLHSPKVLMSAEAQAPSALVTKNRRLDFLTPRSRALEDGHRSVDAAEEALFLGCHFRRLPHPWPALDVQQLLANLQSLGPGPCPVPPHIKIPSSLAEELAAHKSGRELERMGKFTVEELSRSLQPAFNRPVRSSALNLPVKKSLLSPSSGSVEPAREKLHEGLTFSLTSNVQDLLEQSLEGEKIREDLPMIQTSQASTQNEYSLRKKRLMYTAQQWSESANYLQEASETAPQPKAAWDNAGDFSKVNHSPDTNLPSSIDHTLKNIDKMVRAENMKSTSHEFQEPRSTTDLLSSEVPVSTSWSSSSSSSSTFSSSPGGARCLLIEDKNSGASTPTNRHTPPLSENNCSEEISVDSKTTVITDCALSPSTNKPENLVTNGEGCSPAAWSDGCFQTPEATNGVFLEGPTKRRLHLDFASDTTPTLCQENNHHLQKHRENTRPPVKSEEMSILQEVESFTLSNIPTALHQHSPERCPAPRKTESYAQSELLRDSHLKHETPPGMIHANLSNQSCDQITVATDSSSLCKFYLESPSSPSPSLISFNNGAVSSQSLSTYQNLANEDLLIQTWQQLSIDTDGASNDASKESLPNGENGSAHSWSKVADEENAADACPSDTSSVLSNGFVAADKTPNSCYEAQNLVHTTYHNGAVESHILPDSGGESDKVFEVEKQSLPCKQQQGRGPTRTKSAPIFSSLSSKVKATAETETENGSDRASRGRLATREKPLIDASLKGAGPQDRLRQRLVKSASSVFSSRSGLPSQSSPAPVKRRSTGRFDYDESLTCTKAIKNAVSMPRLPDASQCSADCKREAGRILSTSAPASTNSLLGNFEESMLNGRLEPAGVVEGFTVDVGASGSFCPRHLFLPVTAYFFHLSDDNAPSPYLGHISLDDIGKRGYHIPRKGTLQVTLFNPNKTVVKMFVVMYDLADMPPDCQTVIRQRTVYMPADADSEEPSYLRYLIHLRVASSASGKIYLHTDIRLIFARNKFELDSSVPKYELRSFTETPVNPKYSPKR